MGLIFKQVERRAWAITGKSNVFVPWFELQTGITAHICFKIMMYNKYCMIFYVHFIFAVSMYLDVTVGALPTTTVGIAIAIGQVAFKLPLNSTE